MTTVSPKYLVKALGDEERALFDSGDAQLNAYFLERARRDAERNIAAVFVIAALEKPGKVLGFYTLSSLAIEAFELPAALRKKLGRYRWIGATLLGRLAVASEAQGRGLGAMLLLDALSRALRASEEVGSYAVVVDAKGEHVESFYQKYGFQRLSGSRFYLPMASVAELLGNEE